MEGMANDDVDVARRYHEATKHSYSSVRARGEPLDWSNQPLPFKIFPDLPPIALPRDFAASGVSALAAIARQVRRIHSGAADDGERVPSLRQLAYLLFFSAGITRRRQGPGGEVGFRAASCTGALYEIELYVVCQDLDGLPAGVYHFGPADFALRAVRRGDFRQALAAATGDEPAVRHAPVTIVCTGTYWRNAWKYRARTYRHFGWDNGTILANLLAASTALDLPAGVVCGFVDETVNEMLGLDVEREVSFSMVPIGHVSARRPSAGGAASGSPGRCSGRSAGPTCTGSPRRTATSIYAAHSPPRCGVSWACARRPRRTRQPATRSRRSSCAAARPAASSAARPGACRSSQPRSEERCSASRRTSWARWAPPRSCRCSMTPI